MARTRDKADYHLPEDAIFRQPCATNARIAAAKAADTDRAEWLRRVVMRRLGGAERQALRQRARQLGRSA